MYMVVIFSFALFLVLILLVFMWSSLCGPPLSTNSRHFQDKTTLLGLIAPEGLDTNGSLVPMLGVHPLQLTDHNTGISLLLSIRAWVLLTQSSLGVGGGSPFQGFFFRIFFERLPETLEPKFHNFSQNFMGNLLMCISQLPNVRCYHGNHEIKGDFAVFYSYFRNFT